MARLAAVANVGEPAPDEHRPWQDPVAELAKLDMHVGMRIFVPTMWNDLHDCLFLSM